ncbi:dGTPase [Gilliamella apis]|uniref:Probable deoxyguanosinetriphosphate triphosphohydrolase n=1 Tax=Gilliamella apis TaxID=1970738 RepID=A0A2V4DVN0_9GAMM|nr:dGTPase [Gilliamella apis]PXY91559.1 dGTPase [Gilliamella apis]WLS93447.1 dGTPase [Gilliamella apis]
MIDFNKKINYQRYASKQRQASDEYSVLRFFESDRGRILNSAAIRRLQQKTQVFPLERNSVVRTRLTHSMEVQQVGRYIVKEIVNRLSLSGKLKTFGLDKSVMSIESLVEMACLMHDIGNPPFGHFGEAAINQWFTTRLGINNDSSYPILNINETDEQSLKSLKLKIRQDLANFEGNAQAIRLVHTILRLNLTYSQIASILKYSKPAYWSNDIPDEFSYLMKKPGYYLSEESFVNELSQQLDIQPFHRYPLTYIMEAADDISYCIADLEDAVEKKILTVQQLYHYLKEAWGPVKKGDLFDEVVNKPYDNLKKNEFEAIGIDQFFMYLRVNTIAKLVPHAAERFIENIETIYHGSFNHALLEDHEAEYKLLNIFKTVGFEHIFNHEMVENIELQGYRIITGLLDIYSPLLNMSTDDFINLAKTSNHKNYPIETRLYHKLSAKHCVAYQQAIASLDKGHCNFKCWEFYYRCRLIQDYISGMTDHFAYDEYRKLMVTF